jgi:hypothetical protein
MKTCVTLIIAGLCAVAVAAGQFAALAGPGPDGIAVWEGGEDGAIAGGCTPGTGPDVIVGDLMMDGSTITKYGTVGGITGYAMGTTSCNVGNANLQWDSDTPNHPVIAQNLYRLKGGRFEQIGMSWLKHGFSALTQNLCCVCQNPGNSQLLGVGCSDPYGASLNGDQNGFTGCGGVCGGLGPRFEVNATTGAYSFPYFAAGQSGDAIYKRLQVHNSDLDPAQNAGALYWAEGHYVTPDDAAATNHHNNASYEVVTVGSFSGGGWNLALSGQTFRESAAIEAWQAADPQVVITAVEDDGGAPDAHDGRFYLGYRVTDNGNGTWHYEYALYNMNSHRSARTFNVPVDGGAVLSNTGFHDVEYHSGDGEGGVTYDGSDWGISVVNETVSWSTQTITQNPNANALRWGTLYNFRFDADTPPQAVSAWIGLFRSGSPPTVAVETLGPGPQQTVPCPWDCADANGTVDVVDFLGLLAQWGQPATTCDLGLGAPGVGIEEFLDLLGHWGPCP